LAYEVGVVNDVDSYSFNPAINISQLNKAWRYSENASEQITFKTPLDFASPLAHDKQNFSSV